MVRSSPTAGRGCQPVAAVPPSVAAGALRDAQHRGLLVLVVPAAVTCRGRAAVRLLHGELHHVVDPIGLHWSSPVVVEPALRGLADPPQPGHQFKLDAGAEHPGREQHHNQRGCAPQHRVQGQRSGDLVAGYVVTAFLALPAFVVRLGAAELIPNAAPSPGPHRPARLDCAPMALW